MSDEFKDFFLKPTHVTHRKYEALRTLCVEKARAKEVAKKFGYSIFSINAMKRDFISILKSRQLDSSNFFITKSSGRTPDAGKSLLKEKIIQLRKQNYSILDIKSVLHTEGHIVSHDYIYRVLEGEGFARLAKRTQIERKVQASKIVKAPRSCSIDWMSDSGQIFHAERGVGVLPFLPLLARLGVDQWIEAAGYPETSELSRVQNVLSFIALKLAGHNRYSQDDLWAMDRGFGLFGALNVLPKDGTLSSYSYRTNRHMNRRFLTEMFRKLKKLKLLTGQINMDFTAIPHWGDSSVLENNWSGKYGRRLKSVLSLLCQDPDTGIFCYSDAEVKHRNQPESILEFVDFWKENGKKPSCLIFDSKLTTYENLEKLDIDNIKFITLRRRGKKLLSELQHIQEDEWQNIKVEGPSRKHKRLKVHESEILLDKTSRYFRQIIVSGNGHEKEAFIITNDRDRTAAQIIRQYGKRWNVEKGISEQIEFFHLNSLSSSIVVKVDFDLTMTVAAHNFYRIMAQELIGFENETSGSLNSKFFNNGGQFQIEKDLIIIEMKKKRHIQILMEAISRYKNVKIPWLEDRKLKFRLWTTS
ncbi:MAG: putative orf [Candidatus Scalindua rubra]|uniref:Putative orf n=1 Tax=Candidatus Scalindua rubra TaxID=1872076 RepID=A0A1E3XEB9_9BACT|nr:MAG: putative orf [Candidatus Scalindua rubra]